MTTLIAELAAKEKPLESRRAASEILRRILADSVFFFFLFLVSDPFSLPEEERYAIQVEITRCWHPKHRQVFGKNIKKKKKTKNTREEDIFLTLPSFFLSKSKKAT
jgi:hypothetical protein